VRHRVTSHFNWTLLPLRFVKLIPSGNSKTIQGRLSYRMLTTLQKFW